MTTILKLTPMTIKTIPFRAAQKFIEAFHRHSLKPQGHKFSIAIISGARVIGVATVGRPVNPTLDNGETLEITRCCTDGTKNACSKLYSACFRAARHLGYSKIITYTLQNETGSSLKAAGFTIDKVVKGEPWNRIGRPRRDYHTICDRIRWSKTI